MSDIFISYKREDRAVARKLANALESEGWTVWWDPKLRAGEHFDDVIEKALNEAKCIIVLWSNLSVNSEYVKAEATEALEQKKLVPLKIEDVNLPFRFKRVHTPSLLRWNGSKESADFRKLVQDIAEMVCPPVPETKRETDKEKKGSALQEGRAQRTAEKEQEQEQGEDIVSLLVDYMAEAFEKSHRKDLRKESMALERLKVAAQEAITRLSSVEQTEVNLPFITADSTGAKHFAIKLTRMTLESLVPGQIESKD